ATAGTELYSEIRWKAEIRGINSVFPQVADEPAPKKVASKKPGSSNNKRL
ncbi:hypothetical protein ACJX0J_042265, partial [Zea mays]